MGWGLRWAPRNHVLDGSQHTPMGRGTHCKVNCAKTAEPINLPFGLVPHGKYDWTVRLRRWCGHMSNYFDCCSDCEQIAQHNPGSQSIKQQTDRGQFHCSLMQICSWDGSYRFANAAYRVILWRWMREGRQRWRQLQQLSNRYLLLTAVSQRLPATCP